MQLITHQTGPQGQKVQRLLIEETAAIDRELYLGHRAGSRDGEAGLHGVAGGRNGDRRGRGRRSGCDLSRRYIDPAMGLAALPGAASWRLRWG